MVPSPPEVIQWFGCSNLKCCAAHIWCWPTSVVMKMSCFTARVSLVQPLDRVLRLDDRTRAVMSWVNFRLSFARHTSICRHHVVSAWLSTSVVSACHAASSAASARPASAMIGTSTGTFLLIEDGSMSMWILRDPWLNAFSRPVTRSSNRAPTASSTSQPCIARFAS